MDMKRKQYFVYETANADKWSDDVAGQMTELPWQLGGDIGLLSKQNMSSAMKVVFHIQIWSSH